MNENSNAITGCRIIIYAAVVDDNAIFFALTMHYGDIESLSIRSRYK